MYRPICEMQSALNANLRFRVRNCQKLKMTKHLFPSKMKLTTMRNSVNGLQLQAISLTQKKSARPLYYQ
ncbi:hypothetical protein C798_23490 [Herbaspirillum rubrisubalbicans Os34]|uniref:Uncharacterized protein n=1 Tax=Herbaspirillum rubrisubalbicans Os34 TaxID=1235827 RepID=A0A6M3ZXY0_9BURK|nr:hypothetical protein C798_23490 [Herbaspirillum rubrisubalbicans Os34]